ncbi:hypothetical protein [Nitrospira sp. BLG_2]|uniref:hypothetical protein n=1 Tax=Nitrospira sp. BLG_2 TaxID=3397507 RepID=UPI003B9B5F57
MRLQPLSRNAEMKHSLQARIHDPLWLLARQWQLGEFQGEDNGSPIMARWRADAAKLSRYFSGAINANTIANAPRYDPSMPLETLVERETILPANDQTAKLRFAAESGQQFLRMLDQMREAQAISRDYRDAFVRKYPMSRLTPEQRATLDSDSLAFIDLMAARVPDGRLLHTAFRVTNAGVIVIAPDLHVAPGDLADVREAARLWLIWFDTLFSEPEKENTAWLPERMEYAFSVGTRFSDGEVPLTAEEYCEGHLDWYAFDVNLEVTLGGASDDTLTEITRSAIPAPVSFRGMPNARFWEFEDAQVDFGSVDAGPTDLARMLLVEFSLTYGNDWFVIPVELPVGSLYRCRSIVIEDTFGVRTLVRTSSQLSEPHSTWRMFQQSHTRSSGLTKPAANLFFLTPSLLKGMESKPIEEVLFLRDEMANMAWGVERIVESAAEKPLTRFEQEIQTTAPSVETRDPNKLVYKLATKVPDNWVPLLPVKSNEGLRLRRGKVLKVDGPPEFIDAHGNILRPQVTNENGLRIFEEEIPREGIRVTRHYQLTRWHDGSTHLWIGRRKKVGSGEGSSGLKFDVLKS